jgi:hypothetical protein
MIYGMESESIGPEASYADHQEGEYITYHF